MLDVGQGGVHFRLGKVTYLLRIQDFLTKGQPGQRCVKSKYAIIFLLYSRPFEGASICQRCNAVDVVVVVQSFNRR